MIKNDEKGFSLVELIVVIAIVTILATVSAIGISAISSKPAEQASQALKTLISQNRTSSLGKYDAMLNISNDGVTVKGNYSYTLNGTDWLDPKETIICQKNVTVEVSYDGTNYTALDAAGVSIKFDRSSGALKTPDTDIYFRFTKASNSYVVRVYHITGKVIQNKE